MDHFLLNTLYNDTTCPVGCGQNDTPPHILGCTVLRTFIFKSRRIMYLHNILQKDGSELIRKVYEAQKDNPTPGDFCELVRDDCRDIGLNMSDEEKRRCQRQ